MSSFDPDDTTPLMNNQDNSANHGTFNGNPEGDDEPLENGVEQNVLSDDEILGGRQQSVLQRFNPFDRVPNLPPQLAEDLANGVMIEEPESNWSRFKRFVRETIRKFLKIISFSFRFFSFNRDTGDSVEEPLIQDSADVDIIIRPNSSRTINSTGNNILNANLSGSFREDNAISIDASDDDDDILDGRVRRAPKSKTRKHRSAPNIMTTSDQPGTSYGGPSSPNDRLGVVAIPNIQFDPARLGRNNNFI